VRARTREVRVVKSPGVMAHLNMASGLRDAKCLVVVVTAANHKRALNLPLFNCIRSWLKRK
jgi:hypothetical protein